MASVCFSCYILPKQKEPFQGYNYAFKLEILHYALKEADETMIDFFPIASNVICYVYVYLAIMNFYTILAVVY